MRAGQIPDRLQILQEPPHLVVIADHPQGGRAAFKFEDHAGVTADAEFKVILLQSPDTETAVPMRFSKHARQQAQGCVELIQLLIGERLRLTFEARRNLNP
jgi:hypothetical protein